jgi:Tfp pilus assembly protein PilN
MEHCRMTRFDYNAAASGPRFGAPGARWRQPLRLPMAVVATAVLFVAGTLSVEGHRIATLDDELTALAVQTRDVAPDGRRSQGLLAALTQMHAVRDRIEAAHREALSDTNAIAVIGNNLPPQTWLTGVQVAFGGAWSIAGRSTRVAEIARTLRLIQRLDTSGTARLVSISAGGRMGRTLDFVIAWNRLP